ncbi:MAG: hypothetical protein CM15mP58_00060 [Burkholderiaceae bacterium]|nr:MAG: hypothetical protein CM15mP58_00060 [Burkholderiaceae bacterium]
MFLSRFSKCWGHHTQFSPRPGKYARFYFFPCARYSFDRSYLKEIFTKVRLQQKALTLIKPSKTDKSQTVTWDHYRKLFVNKENIDRGKRFISTHIVSLEKAHKNYGVPPEVIAAIIGIETKYGRIKENFLFLIHSQTPPFESRVKKIFSRENFWGL